MNEQSGHSEGRIQANILTPDAIEEIFYDGGWTIIKIRGGEIIYTHDSIRPIDLAKHQKLKKSDIGFAGSVINLSPKTVIVTRGGSHLSLDEEDMQEKINALSTIESMARRRGGTLNRDFSVK